MSEIPLTVSKDPFIDEPNYPEALKDLGRKALVLNMYGPLTLKSPGLRLLIGNVEGVFPVSDSTEMWRRMKLFDEAFPEQVDKNERGFRFGRTELRELPAIFYEALVKPTKYGWGRSRAEDTPPTDLVDGFGLQAEDYADKEIIIIPPHAFSLQPLVEAVQDLTDRVPHIAWWEEILYAGQDVWELQEYRPGMENLLGTIGGAI